jgi:hypothetical protein
MSALPPKPDIAERDWHVRFVPKADMTRGHANNEQESGCATASPLTDGKNFFEKKFFGKTGCTSASTRPKIDAGTAT